jgi:thiol reductant ABC exporter CydC subunit
MIRIAARYALAVVAGIAAAGAGIGLMATAAWLISRAATHPPVLHLMVAIVAVRAFGLSRGVLRYVERIAGHDAALRGVAELRARCYRRLERLAPAGLATFRRGDTVQRLVSDVDAVLDALVRVVLPLAVAAVVAVASVLLIGSLVPAAGWGLAAALTVACVAAPAVQSLIGRHAVRALAPLRGQLAADTVELLHGLPDLVAYGATGPVLDRLTATDRRIRRATERGAAASGVAAALTALATGGCLIVGLAAGTVAVRAGHLSGELLALVVLTPLAVFEAVSAVPAAAGRLAETLSSVRRIAALWQVAEPAPDRDEPEPLPPGPYTIRVDDVTAGWTAQRPAIHHLSFTVPPGRRIALVGESGAGKTTVAALLVRWLDPQDGRVTLNGVDLRDLAGDDIRQVVGLCDDQAYLFDTTIEANLRVGRPDATADELEAALRRARLWEWVTSLPAGLDTRVGELGNAVSGGQRRRLALARALLADKPILVLDEPTEHLDDDTAHDVIRDLLDAARGRTVILITHRLDELTDVDEIVHIGRTPALAL